MSAFDAFVLSRAGFRPRPGQRQMAQAVASHFERDADEQGLHPRFLVVQAGTGVGKSVGYSVPAICAALARKKRVIISTATVALQEQLVDKDLPAIAQSLAQPVSFVLVKGRGRYVCPLKLKRRVDGKAVTVSIFEDEDETAGPGTKGAAAAPVAFYRDLEQALRDKRWSGDRDSLEAQPTQADWGPVAGDRHTCTARNCEFYKECPYFEARRQMAQANVLVVNHDLLLASLGTNVLPDLKESLLVIDEAHSLPGIAADQFSATLDPSRPGWLDQLGKRLAVACTRLSIEHVQRDAMPHMAKLKADMRLLAPMVRDLFDPSASTLVTAQMLFPGGVLPEPMEPVLRSIKGSANELLSCLRAVALEITTRISENGQDATLTELYAGIGALAPRVSGVYEACEKLLTDGQRPHAKWAEMGDEGGYLSLKLNASPIAVDRDNPLSDHLWPAVGQVVMTSATLKACASFDFFLRQAGLGGDTPVQALEVQSPFDFPKQGRLVVVSTTASPKMQDAYEREVVAEMLLDLAQVEHGALVLFTSRRFMETASKALTDELRVRVLEQGATSRAKLLQTHRTRVDAGQPSIIFGLQSFGEGLDLPGRYCDTLLIAKLPFTPPNDPIARARAQWLESRRRNPFAEIVVPAAAVRLAQWAGRAIRTEADQATIICYDKRLTDSDYGRDILAGIPPFSLVRREAGLEAPLPARRPGRPQ